VMLIAIGMIQNVVDPAIDYWGWTILITIGICRLVGYFTLKYPAWVRCALMVVCVVIARPLLLTLVGGGVFAGGFGASLWPQVLTPASFFGWFLFNLANQNTFFPYFGFFLAGTVFVDLLLLQPKEKQAISQRMFVFVGALLVTVGLNLGLFFNTTLDPGDKLLWYLNTFGGKNLAEIPAILSRNSISWSLTALGAQFLLGVLFLQYESWVFKNKTLRIYGEYSLTIYLFSYLVYCCGDGTWHMWWGLPLLAGVVILTRFIFQFWDSKWQGKYSFEWVITLAVKQYRQHLSNKTPMPKSAEPIPEDVEVEPTAIESSVPILGKNT